MVNNINLGMLTLSQGITIDGASSASATGRDLRYAGDVNGDGYDDLIIGAFRLNSYTGAAYIIYGSYSLNDVSLATLNSSQGIVIYGANLGDFTGYSVSYAGDVNKDGFADIIIGAYGAQNKGTSYIIYGGDNLKNIYLANLTTSQGILIYGSTDNSIYGGNWNIGYSVSNAGDINKDGYDDVIIGAPRYTNSGGRTIIGASYIIYGGSSLRNINVASLTTIQGIVITGATGDYETGITYFAFGNCVSYAGDINKDGFADVITQGGGNENNALVGGPTYILYGKDNLNNIDLSYIQTSQGVIISGIGAYYYQKTVSYAGDFNNDGYDDIIIGVASLHQSSGASFIIYGSSNLVNIDLNNFTTTQGLTIFNNAGPTYNSVSYAGDVNNDGHADVTIGANGHIYVVYGSSSLKYLNLADITVSEGCTILAVDSSAGYSSYAGDINKDGYDDIIIGAPSDDGGNGAAYVVYGAALSAALPTESPSINPTYQPSNSPTALPSLVPTQIPSDTPTFMPTRAIEITTGGNINLGSLTTSEGFAISGANPGDYSGCSVSKAGDLNGDGFSDIIIGAYEANSEAGISYVIYGGSSLSNINLKNLTTSQGFSITGYNMIGGLSRIGYSVSGAGDVNKDGYDDIIMGSNDANNIVGISYVIYGGSSLSNINLLNLTTSQGFSITGGEHDHDSFGWSVSGAGDVNKDGYADIIIGAHNANSKDSVVGITYVIYGGNNLSNINFNKNGIDGSIPATQGFSITGEHWCCSGWSVSGAGDVNGDDYADVIIGAPDINLGISYVIYGGSSLNNINLGSLTPTQGFSITGNPRGYSGYSVSSAGDVNKDGYADIIIGAPSANSTAGISYVIYGGSSLSNINLNSLTTTRGFSITGSNPFDQSGWAVSGAGDVNKDGYADMIIGVPGANSLAGISAVGISYVIYGGNILSNINLNSLTPTQGFSILGVDAYDLSGSSVSGAGDFNNDGYDDIIIGAYRANSYVGISYIVYGGQTYLHPTAIPTTSPTTIPTTLPTKSPIINPTYQPTFIPTALPSNSPTVLQSLAPTQSPSSIKNPTNFPTTIPTALPTESPSINPTYQPSNSPTALPSLVPTQIPSDPPTSMPTQAIEITTGGNYSGSSFGENFIINSKEDVTITGGGGTDTYTLEPNANVTITVTDFNIIYDLINLKSYSIYSFNELDITAGSIIITLENNQIIKLLALSPGDINANNFVFTATNAPSFTPTTAHTTTDSSESSSSSLSQSAIIGIAVGVGVGLVAAGYLSYAYCNNGWPFLEIKPGVVNIEENIAQPYVRVSHVGLIGDHLEPQVDVMYGQYEVKL